MANCTAKLNYLKIAPRKTRLVASSLKGLSISDAEAQLLMRSQRAAAALLKLLRSAVANAKNKNLDLNKLYIANVRVDQGPMLKRVLPRSMGRANIVQKKMSHVTLVLEEAPAAFPNRFNIVPAKKEKKEKKKTAKSPKQKEAQKEKAAEKPKERTGFLKKIFRRKSV